MFNSRWKVLRPRLYIAPPPIVRGAAAKSQLKAREREETAARGETVEADGEEHEYEREQAQEREDEDMMDVASKEPLDPETTVDETMNMDVEGLGGGETTADDEEVVQRAAASKTRKRVPPTPEPRPEPEVVETSGISAPPSSAQRHLPQLQAGSGRSPEQTSIGLPAAIHSTKTYQAPESQVVPSQPPAHHSFVQRLTPGQQAASLPPNPSLQFTPPTQAAHHASPSLHQIPHPSLNVPHQTPPNQAIHFSSPNATHHSPQNAAKESRSYTHLPALYAPPARMDDHAGLSPEIDAGQALPVPSVVRQSPSRGTMRGHGQVSPRVDNQQVPLHQQASPQSPHKHSSGGRTLPPLAPQVPSSTSAQSHERIHPATYPTQHSYSPSHLPLPLPLSHSTVQDTRHLATPQSYAPPAEHVWPARAAVYDSPMGDRTYESSGDVGTERNGRREFQTSGERDYQVSGERERAHVSRGREERAYVSLEDRQYAPSSQREERTYGGTSAYVSHEERAHVPREQRGLEREGGRYESRERERESEKERRSRKPEMLPFPLPQEQRSVRRSRDTAAATAFQPSATYPAYQSPSSQASYLPQQTSPYQPSSTFQTSPSFASSQAFLPTQRYAQASSLFTPQELVTREPGQSRLPVLGERTPPTRTEVSPRRGHDTLRRIQDESPRKRRGYDGSPTRRGQSSSQGLSEVPDSTAGDSDGGR